jgi:putative tryptophan/tyrosine transport system substrate-binding protein
LGKQCDVAISIKVIAASAAAWPIAAYAQQSKIPIVGILWHAGNREEDGDRLEVLEQGLADLGYIRGQNITLVHTFASEEYDRFTNNAVELTKLPADVLVAVTQPALMGALRATTTIPIVFLFVSNPVESKLVTSIARPGGNITGLSNIAVDLSGKKLQFLREATGMSRLALLTNTSDREIAERTITAFQASSAPLDISLQVAEVKKSDDLERAFDLMGKIGVGGVVLQVDSMFLNERKQIAKLARERRLATMGLAEEMAQDGLTMSYGLNPFTAVRRAATYVDKILKGTKPGDLPIEQPTKVDFVINLKTAKEIGLNVPATLLVLADRVIE